MEYIVKYFINVSIVVYAVKVLFQSNFHQNELFYY